MSRLRSAILAAACIISMSKAYAMTNHIITAHRYVDSLKENIKEILDKKSKLTLKDIILRLEDLNIKINRLIKDITKQYDHDRDKKCASFLRILKTLKLQVTETIRVLRKKYFLFLTFALAIRNLFNKLNTKEYKEKMRKRLNSLNDKLDISEKKELKGLIKTLDSIHSLVPESKLKILAILKAIYYK